jgi:hypothetical protein
MTNDTIHRHFTRSKTSMAPSVYLTRLQANIRNEVSQQIAQQIQDQQPQQTPQPHHHNTRLQLNKNVYNTDIDFDEASRAWRANKHCHSEGTFTYRDDDLFDM